MTIAYITISLTILITLWSGSVGIHKMLDNGRDSTRLAQGIWLLGMWITILCLILLGLVAQDVNR